MAAAPTSEPQPERAIPSAALVLIAAITLLWGLNWPAMKVVVGEISPWTFRAACVVISGGGLMLLAALGREPIVPPRGFWLPLTGVALLSVLPVPLMAALLGGFVMAYGAWSLRSSAPRTQPPAGAAWAWGIGGGVLGGLFGSGGFVYAAYLQPRLPDRNAFRTTQAVLVSISTLWRVALCAATGLIDGPLLLTALVLLPATHLGNRLAGLVDKRLSVEGFRRVLNGLLIASGLALVARAKGAALIEQLLG